MKRYFSILRFTIVLFSCKNSPADQKIEEYCICAEKIAAMDLYDFEHKGQYTDSIADVLYHEIDSLLDKEHTLSQLKDVAKCSGIIADASCKRRKEFDEKHDR